MTQEDERGYKPESSLGQYPNLEIPKIYHLVRFPCLTTILHRFVSQTPIFILFLSFPLLLTLNSISDAKSPKGILWVFVFLYHSSLILCPFLSDFAPPLIHFLDPYLRSRNKSGEKKGRRKCSDLGVNKQILSLTENVTAYVRLPCTVILSVYLFGLSNIFFLCLHNAV